MFVNKFNVNIDKIKKRNEELIQTKWIDKLSTKQKKYLNFRKGPPQLMNKDGLLGYPDISNYLVNIDKFNEINIKDTKLFIYLSNINKI